MKRMIQNLFSVKVVEQLVIKAIDYLKEQVENYWDKTKDRIITSVTILSTDDLYMPLVEWLKENNFDKNARSYRFRTIWKGGKQKATFGPDYGTYTVYKDGHKIWVKVCTSDQKTTGEIDEQAQTLESIKLTAYGDGKVIIDTLNEIFDIFVTKHEGMVELRVWDGYSWVCHGYLNRQVKGGIILRQGLLEYIEQDIILWGKNKQWYIDRDVPYRRGFLFYGPPGTGKTSLVKQLGRSLNYPVNVMTAGTLSSQTFAKAIRNLAKNSILLIEDIDCFYNNRDAKENNLVDFSTLLNALDGLIAIQDIVLILTTNHKEDLDEALIRPGRIDKLIEIGLCTSEQATRLLLKFFPGTELKISIDENLISPAELQGICLVASSDLEAAHAINNFKPKPRVDIIDKLDCDDYDGTPVNFDL